MSHLIILLPSSAAVSRELLPCAMDLTYRVDPPTYEGPAPGYLRLPLPGVEGGKEGHILKVSRSRSPHSQSSLNSSVTELTLRFYHILKGLLDEDEAADWILAFLPFILLV